MLAFRHLHALSVERLGSPDVNISLELQVELTVPDVSRTLRLQVEVVFLGGMRFPGMQTNLLVPYACRPLWQEKWWARRWNIDMTGQNL